MKLLTIKTFEISTGENFHDIPLTYEIFGDPKQKDLILINHALTGNSHVTGPNGWWSNFVAPNGPLDLNRFSLLCFNIPGNRYAPIPHDDHFSSQLGTLDVARLFLAGLKQLGISHLHAVMGVSLGGLITWQMAIEAPELASHWVPIGATYESSDWVRAHTFIQEQIITLTPQMEEAIKICRMMGMMFYRTPKLFGDRFNKTWSQDKGIPNVESYLIYQGEKLLQRMDPYAYRQMNRLLGSQDLAHERGKPVKEILEGLKGEITLVAISSDILFPYRDIKKNYDLLKRMGKTVYFGKMKSDFGHDAFLLETGSLASHLKHVLTE